MKTIQQKEKEKQAEDLHTLLAYLDARTPWDLRRVATVYIEDLALALRVGRRGQGTTPHLILTDEQLLKLIGTVPPREAGTVPPDVLRATLLAHVHAVHKAVPKHILAALKEVHVTLKDQAQPPKTEAPEIKVNTP